MMDDVQGTKRTYSIRETSKLVGIESHVLRYWEEELGIKIERNELGHRLYREKDITLFKEVKRLKDGGIGLKAIRTMLIEIKESGENESSKEIGNSEVIKAVQEAAGTICGAQAENEEETEDRQGEGPERSYVVKREGEIEETRRGQVVDFKLAQLQAILNRAVAAALTETLTETLTESVKAVVTETVVKQMDMLLREQEEREEERFRKLDERLRALQKSKKRRLFKK